MNILKFLFLLSFLFSTMNAQQKTTRTLDKDEVIQGTKFKKGSIVEQDEKNYLYSAILSSDQVIIDQIKGLNLPHIFPKGTVITYEDPIDMFGKPRMNSFIPAKAVSPSPVKIYSVTISPETEINFYGGTMTENNKVTYFFEMTVVLSEDIKINKKNIPKGSYIKIESKNKMQVSKNGGWEELF